MTNAEAWFNKSLRPRKPEGSLGRTAQDVHLDSHTAPAMSPQKPLLWLIRDREKGGRCGRGRSHTYRYTVTTTENDSCIKMGRDESHFNVSLIMMRDN